MTYPAITAFYAALLGLIYVAIAVWVVVGRVSEDTLFGNGNATLTKRVRVHGNFIEYVPLALLLIALFEAGGGSATVVRTLLIVLVITRLLQPLGMFAPKNSPQQFAFRGGGILVTLGVIVAAAVELLLH